MHSTFDALLKAATGKGSHGYQHWLVRGHARIPCASQIISIPTRLGETAF
jgi:hypothetical protein